ncbi:MAG TPA: hypothetical protein VNY05_12535 [Candidatus Acidoferrales bacterium]|nr:hypothetical protein [Candidatus Acidoferrales bacterium]
MRTISNSQPKRSFFLSSSMAACVFLAGAAAWAQPAATVIRASAFAVSSNVKDMPDDNDEHPPNAHPKHGLPSKGDGASGDDGALQQEHGDDVKAQKNPLFPGVGANGSAPPDPNIAVGPNHIVQTVNTRIAVFDHAGTQLVAPKSLSSLWTALGGPCAVANAGDPIVQYDRLADRWVVTQIGSITAPFSECVAVSQTNDPGGAFFLYSFPFGTQLNDYGKIGVWPTATNSAYLASYNLFLNAATFTGADLCAYDRKAMLSGAPNPAAICFTISNDAGFLPSDLDGSTPPVDGTTGYFLNFETTSSLRMFKLAPNFANPAASTLTAVPDIASAAFSQACGGGACIPQSGTTTLLDSLGDRLMYRLAFRMFPDHEAMVVNHSVTAGTTVGVRWYELRAPVSAAGAFSLFQQGTFAPADTTFRWMASAAMDQAGDIAIGYSASSSTLHPAIRFTGRAPGDAVGTMGTESSLFEGPGSQTGGLVRWGDYTALRIDPLDDCTLWYTNEFLPANGSFNWSTFIGSFRFAGCGTPDFSISASPASQTVVTGNSTSYLVSAAALGGFTGTVGLTVSGLPAGAAGSFSLTPLSLPGSSTLTVTTTNGTTPTGTFTLTITGTSGTLTHTATVALVVNPVPVPDFTISATPASRTVTPGASTTYTTTVTAVNGFTGTATFSVSGLPAGATGTFVPASVTGSGTSTLTVATLSTTPTGTFTVTITGASGTLTHSATVTLIVNGRNFSLTATPASRSVARRSSANYTATVTPAGGFTGTVTFAVSGLPANATASFSPNSIVTSGSTTMRVRTNNNTALGTFTLTLTATSGTLSHSTPVTLTVTP